MSNTCSRYQATQAKDTQAMLTQQRDKESLNSSTQAKPSSARGTA